MDARWSGWLAGQGLIHVEEDMAPLSVSAPDQAVIHGLLERIRDSDPRLISTTRGGPFTSNTLEEKEMKTLVVSYSMTGNNDAVAAVLADELSAEHVRIQERKARTMGTIALDVLFKRTPKINMPVDEIGEYDLVLFVGPVWMGQIATPFRACFETLGHQIREYAFVSVCGGADGPNPKVEDELRSRLGRAPLCHLELHIADLLPSEPEPTRDMTMAYRLTAQDLQHLSDTIVPDLERALASQGAAVAA